ncbi:PAS domain S-box protein [Spirosoma linguale]|uniref:histidine kinase n=1 Tax=Spirosoma linguale (strain ATCC 33905 / DSM 74 / LMG 10896 / Claus 1) TaxID=504472 RepID=D2QJX0_SPILD|nr:multi-sensor signal transduction histidine kinase [Spirosoma linguale DSM 74]
MNKSSPLFEEKNQYGFSKSNLLVDDLPDLPMGIVVCKPVKSKTGAVTKLKITYCNPFAASLLEWHDEAGEAICLNDIPELITLLKPAIHVLETGYPVTTDIHIGKSKNVPLHTCSIRRHNGQCIIYLEATGPKEKLNSDLQRRLQLEAIISSMSSRLLSIAAPDLDTFILESLARIGEYNRADRVYVFKYLNNGTIMSCTHEWCAEGIDPQLPHMQNDPVSLYPWWHQKMINQESIRLATLDDLPAYAIPERKSLKRQSIKSLLVMPMILDGNLIGYVGFDAVREERNWDENDTDLLKTFASLIINATSRVVREQLLQRANKRLEGLNKISTALLNSSLLNEQPGFTALKYVYEMIPCEVGILFRIDKNDQSAFTESRIRRGKQEHRRDIRFSAEFLRHPTFLQGRELLINQLQADTPSFPPGFNPFQWGHHSFLGVPLFAHQQYIGLVVLLDKTPDFFTAEHILIAREVADQLSIVLLQEEVNRQLGEQAGKLHENNQLLQAIIDHTPAVLAFWEPVRIDGRIVDFKYLLSNPVNSAVTGYSHEELMHSTLVTLFPFTRDNGIFSRAVEVAETGNSQQFQLKYRLKTGDLWGEYSLVRVGGNVLLTIKDISHLKETEEQLRQSNAELEKRVAARTGEIQQLFAMQQAVFKHAGLAITATDAQGVIQLVNPALESLTGYTADELIGKVTPRALRDPVFHQNLLQKLAPDLVDDGTGEEHVIEYIRKNDFLRRENVLLTKQGQRIPVLSTVSGLYDDNNVLIGFVDIVADISYLKTIEHKLMQANQRSRLATMAGKLGVWEWNLLTNEIMMDENFLVLFGLPENASIKRIEDLEQIVHPDDLAYFKQNVQNIIESQKPFDVEFRVFFPSTKTTHYLKADGLIVQNEDGINNRLIGVIRDRTKKRQADQALKISEKRYRSLVDHLKDIVFQIDTSGCLTYLNPVWQKITGFSLEETLGKPFLDFVFPDDRERNQYLCDQLICRQKAICQHVVRYIHKDGGYRWIDVFAQLTVNELDEVTGITGTFTDITERKKAEDALLESEQRFRDIAENVDEIFWIRDLLEPKFIYINPAYEKFTGQLAETLYENPLVFLNFILEEDRSKVLANFVDEANQDSTFQFRARHKDGSLRHLDVRLFRVVNEEGVLIRRIGMATDITTAIEKELILEESLTKERTLNALKSQFISTASHEFRTPLAAINSSVELVKHYVNVGSADTPMTKVINQHIEKICQKVFFLNDLITDTLTISKIDEGRITVNLELTDLIELYENTVKHYFSDREDNRFVEFEYIGNPVTVNLDRKLTEHILTNLLSNAFKFSNKNPRLTISFCTEEVMMTIRDEGIGIPEKDIANLFGKFFRASNVTGFQGTGLGLAICQEYITLQNGRITCESREGVGTSFKVYFPFSANEQP